MRQGAVLLPFLFVVYVDEIDNLCDARLGAFVVLYADEILLMSPSITGLQNLLSACQELLDSLNMVINTKKSSCMRIGPRYDKSCANTPCLKKTVQNSFCQNFVKFLPIMTIFGRKMAKRLKLCEVHSFSTSSNSHHHTTALNADVPNGSTTL